MKDNHVLNKEVGIWIRVSTDDQAAGDSPEHHEHRARSFAQSRGWQVKELYDLAGISGKSVMNHPEAKRMLADIKRGHITGLIFSKLARICRNKRELEDLAVWFNTHNADLISLQDSIDTSTPTGRMFYTFQAGQAQWEREEIADRVKASVLTRAKLGKSINGSAPFGYHWKDRKLLIQPEEATIRRQAYNLFLEHRRKGQVARMLNAAGYRSRNGSIWRDTQVLRTLVDPSAKGIYYFNTMRQTDKSWKTEPKPESEWGKVQCEPIVTEELWNQVNQIIEEQLKSWKRPGKPPTYLFSGLAHCACGHKMYVRSDSPKYVCRKCCNKIPIVDLENIVRQELQVFFTQPERVTEHLAGADRNRTEKQALLDTHQREAQKVRDEMKQTHKLYLEGHITAQGFGQFYKPAEERLNQLVAGLPKLQAEVDFLKVNHLSAADLLQEAGSLYDRWPSLPAENKRKIVECLVEKIVIGDDEIDITLSHLPSSEEACKNQQCLGSG